MFAENFITFPKCIKILSYIDYRNYIYYKWFIRHFKNLSDFRELSFCGRGACFPLNIRIRVKQIL